MEDTRTGSLTASGEVKATLIIKVKQILAIKTAKRTRHNYLVISFSICLANHAWGGGAHWLGVGWGAPTTQISWKNKMITRIKKLQVWSLDSYYPKQNIEQITESWLYFQRQAVLPGLWLGNSKTTSGLFIAFWLAATDNHSDQRVCVCFSNPGILLWRYLGGNKTLITQATLALVRLIVVFLFNDLTNFIIYIYNPSA